MGNTAAFVLPAGINLDVSGGQFSLTHNGDVILEQTFGLPLGTVSADGDLTLRVGDVDGELSAGGNASIEGAISGSLSAGGDAEISGDASGNIQVKGAVTIAGNVSGTVNATGKVNVSGDSNDAAIESEDQITIKGEARGGSLATTGNVSVDGNVQGVSIKASSMALSGDTVSAQSLHCDGALEIAGDVSGDLIQGESITLSGNDIQVKAISATKKIVIGSGKLKVDIIIAPVVEIADGASGRVTVIEANNDPSFGRIKGGFSLAEYEDLFGDSTQFMTDRGVTALGEAPASAPEVQKASNAEASSEDKAPKGKTKAKAKAKVAADESEPEESIEAVAESDAPPEDDEDEEIEIVAAAVSAAPAEPASTETVDLSGEPGDDFYPRLSEAIERITSCYEGMEVPTAVTDLQNLVEARDYEGLRSNITEVWNGLLGFHQTKGIRPHHQVTHAFNVIHGLIQKSA